MSVKPNTITHWDELSELRFEEGWQTKEVLLITNSI